MPQFQRRPLAAAVIMMLSVPSVAMAQSSEPTLPEVKVKESQEAAGFRTETSRTGTRTDTPLRDIPQFINTVPQSLIRSQNATTLQDALRNVPGISYAAAEGGTQANQVFYLRGFPINQDIFVDGVRDLGEYNRDLFATESVEVLKGSSALLYGRGSTGGLINQVAKTADRLERREVSLTAGGYDQKRLTGDLNVRTSDSSAFRVVALGEDSGSFRYPRGVEKYGVAPSLWMNVGKATDITLSYYYLNEKSVTDYGQPTRFNNATGFLGFPLVSPETYYGSAAFDYANYQTQIATFKIESQLTDALNFRNTLRWANYRRQSESTIAQGIGATDANGNPVTAATPASLLLVTANHDSGRTRDNDDHALINQTELIWKPVTGTVKHTVLTGLELAREELKRWNYTLDANSALAGAQASQVISPYLAPNPYAFPSYTKTPNQTYESTGDTIAVYVQDQLELTQQWKAVLGARWEKFSTDFKNYNSLTGALTPPNANFAAAASKTDNMLSGRAGLIWQPTNAQSYYVSWGNSYNPSGELGVYGQTGTNLSNANLNVDPEKNVNYEIGAQWDVLRGLQLRSALFRNEKTNARIPDPSGSGLSVLDGKRTVEGIEFEATGSITPNWDVYSGISIMNADISGGANNGRTPLGVPDFSGNVWTVYRLGDGWEVGGGARGQSGAWLTDTNLPGSQIPDYVVFDATVAYVQKQYEIRLNAYNIADKVYYIGGYNNSPNRVLPGLPRTASVTVRYNF